MVREAKKEDLKQTLKLYLYLHEESIPEQSDCLSNTWKQILEDEECLEYAKQTAKLQPAIRSCC